MASESKAIELVFKNSDDIDETKGILKTFCSTGSLA